MAYVKTIGITQPVEPVYPALPYKVQDVPYRLPACVVEVELAPAVEYLSVFSGVREVVPLEYIRRDHPRARDSGVHEDLSGGVSQDLAQLHVLPVYDIHKVSELFRMVRKGEYGPLQPHGSQKEILQRRGRCPYEEDPIFSHYLQPLLQVFVIGLVGRIFDDILVDLEVIRSFQKVLFREVCVSLFRVHPDRGEGADRGAIFGADFAVLLRAPHLDFGPYDPVAGEDSPLHVVGPYLPVELHPEPQGIVGIFLPYGLPPVHDELPVFRQGAEEPPGAEGYPRGSIRFPSPEDRKGPLP